MDNPEINRYIEALIQPQGIDSRLRREAVHELGKIGDASLIPVLAVALRDPDLGVYKGAANALLQIGVPAIPALAEALKDEYGEVRDTAAKTLGEIGDASAIPALTEALGDKDENVRREAVRGLGILEMPLPSRLLLRR